MIPDIEKPENPIPHGAKDQGDGYVLLRAMDNAPRAVQPCESKVIRAYMEDCVGKVLAEDWNPLITRWARLRLPMGKLLDLHGKKISRG